MIVLYNLIFWKFHLGWGANTTKNTATLRCTCIRKVESLMSKNSQKIWISKIYGLENINTSWSNLWDKAFHTFACKTELVRRNIWRQLYVKLKTTVPLLPAQLCSVYCLQNLLLCISDIGITFVNDNFLSLCFVNLHTKFLRTVLL